MRHVDPATAVQAATVMPLPLPIPTPMTRQQKLLRWADLIARHAEGLRIFHHLEWMQEWQLAAAYDPRSAFAVALADPVLREAGITGDVSMFGKNDQLSALGAKKFFELSQAELHEFSCDCARAIAPSTMAERIRAIAGRAG